MYDVIEVALQGVGSGAVYALIGLGIVAIYRGSGVLSFAQSAIGGVGAYVFVSFHDAGVPIGVAIGAGSLFAGLLGLLVHYLVMRPLRETTALARLVGTLAVLLIAQSATVIVFGVDIKLVPQFLPTTLVTLPGDIVVASDRLLLLGVAVLASLVLWLVYRFSTFGLLTAAVAENPLVAESLGRNPSAVGAANWFIGSAVAGLAGCFIAPLTGLDTNELALLIVPGMAAALFGGFRSFPLTLLGALAMGAMESATTRYVNEPGWGRSVPLVVAMLVLVVRGQNLPLRSFVAEIPPRVTSGVMRWRSVLVAGAVTLALVWTIASPKLVDSVATTLVFGTLALSLVVVTGMAGQLSIGQFALAGCAALIGGRSIAAGLPAEVALVLAVVATVPVGLLFALPSFRRRGVSLAIATLLLALVVEQLLFNNVDLTGGLSGTRVGDVRVLGVPIGAVAHPERYATLALLAFIGLSVVVMNLRRSDAGRRLIAVRTNERAAAALGVNVRAAKTFAFMVATTVAAVGGVLLAVRYPSVDYSAFGVFSSINLVTLTVLGGIGTAIGALVGGGMAPGGIGSVMSSAIGLKSLGNHLNLLTGLLLIVFLAADSNGLAAHYGRLLRVLTGRFRRARPPVDVHAPLHVSLSDGRVDAVGPKRLEVTDISVTFGGVRAVTEVSLTVEPGEIVGVIGANGAGKTTLIDAITGFVDLARGSIRLGGEVLSGRPPHQRARRGLGRSFQSLELFDDVSVGENVATACADPTWTAYPIGLVRRAGDVVLTPAASRLVRELGLEPRLLDAPSGLPYGSRRLVALARAGAAMPSALLLDEPSSGLSGPETVELQATIRLLARDWGIGILVVEHDVQLIMEVCDRVLVLDGGRTIAMGTPSEVRSDPRVIAAYLGTSASEGDEDAVARGRRQPA